MSSRRSGTDRSGADAESNGRRCRAGARRASRYLRRNPLAAVGLLPALGAAALRRHRAPDGRHDPAAVRSRRGSLQPPSRELPFGSDKQGRNLYAVMVEGTPLTLRIGLMAGFIGRHDRRHAGVHRRLTTAASSTP